MSFWHDLMAYDYLSHALWAAILSGIACGVVGTYIVARRQVFLAGGITHSSFGGLGIAFYLGLNPILGALLFALGAAWGIEWCSEKGRIREDSAIGIIWSVGMAIGALFMALRPGYTSGELSNYLFGSIITVTRADVLALATLCFVILLGILLWYRPIFYTAFDREFAQSQGVPVQRISYLMAAIVAIAIVLSIRVMGIVLLLSLLTLPVTIANTLSRDYRHLLLLAPLLGIMGNVIGLILSYYLEVPPGAAIIFTLTLVLIAVKILYLCQLKHKIAQKL
uniref:metal ABC transporter permease n=1 Tax=Alistipes sp. TaxID=1872444 RepID=UPI004056F5D2